MHAKAEWILLLEELQEPNVRDVIIVPKYDGGDVTCRDNPANRKVLKFCNEDNGVKIIQIMYVCKGKGVRLSIRNISSLRNVSGF